ncbi:MAG: C13 family peptidase [Brevundimonas sp.]|uniref:C13 family peptidase n=1 Tax=Brevundimonas sp. TaxID=1871086 RepID=UPI0027372743|nr:C13 family peptidase [Brevundimonas sp.]MDP3403871.1 C13 family peptidase [Brevundimonas sp.]
MRWRVVLVVLLALMAGTASATAQSAPSGRFDGWAAAIIAADWRDGADQPIEAFDNARRDLAAGFLAAGFDRATLVDYSLRPDRLPATPASAAVAGVAEVTARATRGCLLYFTAHGSPEGMVFGPDRMLSPTAMASLVRGWCQDRPTVVIVSACYSGIFVDGLAGPNRMILTAARRDRSSFGCSAEATWPYFDGCVIQTLPTAGDFIALSQSVRACVAAREAAEGLSPASEPQVRIGASMQLLLPTLRFTRPPE